MRTSGTHASINLAGGAAPTGDAKVNGYMIILPDDLQLFGIDEKRLTEFVAEAVASLPLGEKFDTTSLAVLFNSAWTRGVIVHDPRLAARVSSIADADGCDQYWDLTVASATAVNLPALPHTGINDIEAFSTPQMSASEQVRAGLTEVVEMANSILWKVQEETPDSPS